MRLLSKLAVVTALAAVALIAAGPVAAQQKLKWAHVYETSEPYHKWSVWAAEEIKKRSNGKFDITVFPASSLGKETDINQGLQLGTVDMIISGPIVRSAQLSAARYCLLPVHLPRRGPPDRLLEEPDIQGDGRRHAREDGNTDHAHTRTTELARRRRIGHSTTAPE